MKDHILISDGEDQATPIPSRRSMKRYWLRQIQRPSQSCVAGAMSNDVVPSHPFSPRSAANHKPRMRWTATTSAIIAGLIVIEAIKVLKKDEIKYRLTYCLRTPKQKVAAYASRAIWNLILHVMSAPRPLWYLRLILGRNSKLRDLVDKIVKAKLGMNLPMIMHGTSLLYEVGDDLDDIMVANYNANLEKFLLELSSPIVNGSILTVEDFQQELSCKINVKHREEFDEEKEPEGMVLSGWTKSPATNGESASTSKNENAIDVAESSSGSETASKKRELSETEPDNHTKKKKQRTSRVKMMISWKLKIL